MRPRNHPEGGIGVSAATKLVGQQQRVKTVDLQQVEQEEPVAVRVQSHGPHALRGQRRVRTGGHLVQGLKNPVVLLQEKPEVKIYVGVCARFSD